MHSTGHIVFDGIECVYIIEKHAIRLIPANPDNYRKLNMHFDDQDFMFSFDNIGENNLAYIDRAQINLGESLDLYPKYIISMLRKGLISSMELTGPAIDEVFHPAGYFYIKARTGLDNEKDLTREIEEADKWTITINTISVDVTLQYGGILRRGLASDIMLHPQIVVSFPPTDDSTFLYEVYSTITRFLEIVQYNSNFGECKVRLWGEAPDYTSGFFYDWKQMGAKRSFYNDAEYLHIKPYIGRLLQFSADNLSISLDFLPDATYRWNRTDYSPQTFSSLFAAFESEYKANQKAFELAPPDDLTTIKGTLVKKIHECNSEKLTESEKHFIEEAEQRIQQLGNQVGQTRKMANVITALSPALMSSAKRLFIREKIGNAKGFSQKEINRIAQKTVGLRSQVSHEYTLVSFDDFQAEYVHFLEIIVHAQMLKRAGIDDGGIELLLDLVFSCNGSHMKQLQGNGNQQDKEN